MQALEYRCRCGSMACVSNEQPPVCFGCWHCGTNLTIGGVLSASALQHDYYSEEMVLAQSGMVVTVQVCKWCSAPKASLSRSATIV